MDDTQPEALRRFRAALTGHALTTTEKAAVLIVLDKCADEMERLLDALRVARDYAAYAQAEPADLAMIDAALGKAADATPMPHNNQGKRQP